MRHWHIWDFPDSVYVFIKDETREKFFSLLYEKFGSRRRFARFLNLDPSTVKELHKGFSKKNGKVYIQYMPNWILKKSKGFLTNNIIKLIECSILAYRARAGSAVKNPILPIKESPTLYRLASHIMGDGSASKGKMPYYSNTCKELLKEFKNDLKYFGESSLIEYMNNNKVTLISFPKVIADVVQYILKISFIKRNRLSPYLFNASKACKAAAVRAFFDDEGTVSTVLGVYQSNFRLMIEIKTLLNQFSISSGVISERLKKGRKPHYTFAIKRSSFIKFKKLIGFNHPVKNEKLKFAIRTKLRKKRYRKIEVIDEIVYNNLKNEPKTTLDIANNAKFTLGHMLNHLKRLKNEGKIKCCIKGGKFRWYI